MNKGVATTHREYDEMLPLWTRCKDAAEGTHSVWAKGEEYLPKLTGETNADYEKRKHRTVFYNATWRTMVGFLGLLFRKPAVTVVPDAVRYMMDDITLTGVSLQLFAAEVSEDLLIYGRVGIWVNYPEMKDGKTRADAIAANVRPSMVSYGATSITNWKTARVANAIVLSMVTLLEEHEAPNGEFEVNVVPRWRVLDLDNGAYRVRVFEQKDGPNGEKVDVLMEGPFYPKMNGALMGFIPFYFITPDDTSPEVDIPPFIDLVDMNLAHYQVTADYEHGCHWSGIPTVVITGHSVQHGETIPVGGAAALILAAPEAKAFLLEIGTGGFTALEKNLDRKEAQMVVLGARLLEVQKPGIEAAETALIHRSGEQSILASMAQTNSLGITGALRTFVQWTGVQGDASFWLNREFFHTPMTSDMVNSLVKSWQSGAMSFETMFDNLKKGEIYPPDADVEEEKKRIETAGLPPAPSTKNQPIGPPQ